jgi:arylsulfatase A-like enzyme
MHYPHYGNWVTGGYPATSVVSEGWKLLRFYFDAPEQKHRFELYHLEEDAGETVNLAEKHPERVKALDLLIENFLSETRSVQPNPNPEPRSESGIK